MTDNVERLRKLAHSRMSTGEADIEFAAADEIERLRAELAYVQAREEELRSHHFSQNEYMGKIVGTMRDALQAVVANLLPPNATPGTMLGWGEPWPQVARALWPQEEGNHVTG